MMPADVLAPNRYQAIRNHRWLVSHESYRTAHIHGCQYFSAIQHKTSDKIKVLLPTIAECLKIYNPIKGRTEQCTYIAILSLTVHNLTALDMLPKLTHWGLKKKPFCRQYFPYAFSWFFFFFFLYFDSNFSLSCSLGFKWQQSSISSGDGLVSNRQIAWCHIGSLS